MKSLNKLRDGLIVWDNGKGSFDGSAAGENARRLADEIQAEIDGWYLPRPLFEDGEPAQFGDKFISSDGVTSKITGIATFADGSFTLFGQELGVARDSGEGFKRPPEPDTQEKIDEDKHMFAVDYCCKYKLNQSHSINSMIDHLLERQRKVCEGKS